MQLEPRTLGRATHYRGTERVLVFPGPPDTIIQVILSRGQLKASGEDSGKNPVEAENWDVGPLGMDGSQSVGTASPGVISHEQVP